MDSRHREKIRRLEELLESGSLEEMWDLVCRLSEEEMRNLQREMAEMEWESAERLRRMRRERHLDL